MYQRDTPELKIEYTIDKYSMVFKLRCVPLVHVPKIELLMGGNSFYIKTFGCKVNQYESQVVRESLLGAGYVEVDRMVDANICVINSCTVTATGDAKSVRAVRGAVKAGDKIVIMTGCLVEAEDFDLTRVGGVNYLIKNKDKYSIPELLKNTTFKDTHERRERKGVHGLAGHTRAFVKVQDGCDNSCSYCKVRIVRGKSRSRIPGDVIEECGNLTEAGVKEIVLTGICLGSYGKDISGETDLSSLVSDLCRIKGKWRLRLSSIEPKDVTDSLLSQFKNQDKLCRHLHLPFQSGDDDILRMMKRPYTRGDYLKTVRDIKNTVPGASITTDIMVGFPGETEAMFKNTVDFLKKVKPLRIHVFPYSKRIGTAAYRLKDEVNPEIKEKREKDVIKLGEARYDDFVMSCVGTEVNVLIEHKKTPDGLLQGYTDTYIKVLLNGSDSFMGNLIKCRLTLTNNEAYGILLSYLN